MLIGYCRVSTADQNLSLQKDELEKLQDIYHERYSREERKAAEKMNMPLSEPVPMQYSLLNSGDIAAHDAAGASSSG